jgi:hypothetical protein
MLMQPVQRIVWLVPLVLQQLLQWRLWLMLGVPLLW